MYPVFLPSYIRSYLNFVSLGTYKTGNTTYYHIITDRNVSFSESIWRTEWYFLKTDYSI